MASAPENFNDKQTNSLGPPHSLHRRDTPSPNISTARNPPLSKHPRQRSGSSKLESTADFSLVAYTFLYCLSAAMNFQKQRLLK
ncbi:MAG: hypothetical protein CMM07_03265 [Rhodopirellula sp.]|nr:hypothetical protein [Rhodopirellula sp.]